MAATGNRIWPTLWVLVAATLGIGIVYFVPPSCFPPCPLHALTGLNCPGCGATRAAHELAHGHVRTALHLNALLVLAIPAVVIAGLWRGTNLRTSALIGWSLLGLIIMFGIVRNIPIQPFTYLAP